MAHRPALTARLSSETSKRERDEWYMFTATCRAAEQFNKDSIAYGSTEPTEEDPLSTAIATAPLNDIERSRLEGLSPIRKRAGHISRYLNQFREFTLTLIFLMMAVSALFFHFYAHFPALLIQNPLPADRGSVGKASIRENEQHEPAFLLESLVSLLIIAAAVCYLRISKLEARRLDARTLAEALRIRCWWGLAGLDASVAENYLNQLRGEMTWARRALHAISPPPAMWKAWFNEHNSEEKLQRLGCVRDLWVERQLCKFYQPTVARYEARRSSGTGSAGDLQALDG